jgi:hypothetical protein
VLLVAAAAAEALVMPAGPCMACRLLPATTHCAVPLPLPLLALPLPLPDAGTTMHRHSRLCCLQGGACWMRTC